MPKQSTQSGANARRWALRAFALTLAAAGGSASAFAVPAIPGMPASFTETISAGGLGATGLFDDQPEAISFDFSNGEVQLVAAVQTSASGPNVDVQASNVGGGGIFGAGGTVQFAIMVVPIDPLAPLDVLIPIQISVSGSASVTNLEEPDDNPGFRTGSAEVTVILIADNSSGLFDEEDFDFGAIGTDGRLDAVACDSERPEEDCPGVSPGAELSLNATFLSVPHLPILVTKQATVSLMSFFEGQAVIDPIFAIDPVFCIEVEGSCRPATSLYELAFSEGINGAAFGGPGVSAPASLTVLGIGLALLAGLRLRGETESGGGACGALPSGLHGCAISPV